MDKILSIIVPTYNMENYLHKCLDSLLVSDENMQRLEVLVINDGSKDSSSKIAHEYELKYPETFRVIDKENGNYGSCINRGLKEATGKYVKVLDSDDYFDNKVFNDYISFLNEKSADLIISEFQIVNEEDVITKTYSFDRLPRKTFELNDIPYKYIENLWHQAIAYNRRVFDNLGYKQTEGISYTDDEWVFMPMINVQSVVYFPHTLYFYLRGRVGQTFDQEVVKRTLHQRKEVAKSMINFYVDHFEMIPKCSYDFMRDKISKRLKTVYSYHIVKYDSLENRKSIISFDKELREKSPFLFSSIGEMRNRLGWKYIKQWRRFGYSQFAPDILVMKLLNKLIPLNKF